MTTYRRYDLDKSPNFLPHACTPWSTRQRPPRLVRPVTDGPAAPSVAVGHRPTAPSPSGAAAGTLEAPNLADLAPPPRGASDARSRRARGRPTTTALAAKAVLHAPRTPPVLPDVAAPLARAGMRMCRPLTAVAASWRPARAHSGPSSTVVGGGAAAAAHARGTQEEVGESWVTWALGQRSVAAAAAAVAGLRGLTHASTCTLAGMGS